MHEPQGQDQAKHDDPKLVVMTGDTQEPEGKDEEPVVISVYTRQNALDDGVLIDVTKEAREAGFAIPVAMTAESFGRCVAWTKDDSKRTGTYQDQAGRLWDVVWMAHVAVRSVTKNGAEASRFARDVHQSSGGSQLTYDLYVVPRDKGGKPKRTSLKLMIGPGDDLRPVATIMETHED